MAALFSRVIQLLLFRKLNGQAQLIVCEEDRSKWK
jgi:hypothetical protein